MPSSPFQIRFATPIAYAIAAIVLFGVLHLHLVSALFAGMLVFLVVHAAAPMFGRRISGRRGRLLATAVLAAIVIIGLLASLMALVALAKKPNGGMEQLWDQLSITLQGGRAFLPPWLTAQLPLDGTELKSMVFHWFDLHTREISVVGKEAGITLAQVLIGMIIGAMVALHEPNTSWQPQAFPLAMLERVRNFHAAFSDVVGAQLKIALINAALTWFFLEVILPLSGVNMPLVKTLVSITVVVGMLPVIGNVISNALIVLVGMSVSLVAAGLCLIFLVVLHKGEYFLNARIVGHRIDANAWELLLAILVMEASFGLPGIAAAPIFYAYIKRELLAARWL